MYGTGSYDLRQRAPMRCRGCKRCSSVPLARQLVVSSLGALLVALRAVQVLPLALRAGMAWRRARSHYARGMRVATDPSAVRL